MSSKPPAKRQKVSNRHHSQEFTPNETTQLLQIFNHLKSQNIQNQTLDGCMYRAYKQSSRALNKDDPQRHKANVAEVDAKIGGIATNRTIIPSNLFFEQLKCLKAQLKAYRLLSRDMKPSKVLSDLTQGIDNVHSLQRTMMDPLRTMNPSVCGHSKYDLMAKQMQEGRAADDDILIDSTPQTIEQLVYQNEFDGMKQLVQRRRILRDFVKRCDAQRTAKNNKRQHPPKYDVAEYVATRDELQLLELCELQRKMRKEMLDTRLDRVVRDTMDDGDNEVLLDPALFAREARLGLQFSSNINSANHPPTMATSDDIFPFFYEGNK